MAASLLGLALGVLPFPSQHHSPPSAGVSLTMIKALMQLLFSTGFGSSDAAQDIDFFNEPSTMRPHLTAAEAAAKQGAGEDVETPPTTPSTLYQVVAKGLPGAQIHYAAMSA